LVTPPFVVAVVMLGIAAVLAGPVGRWMKIKHAKLPLPLVSPLSALDEEALAPYRVLERHILDPTIVEALGTDMYINWTLEDTSVGSNDPLRYASLLVTYDTGGRNLVPHRPDVCYLGMGYEPAQPHENIEIDLRSLAPEATKVPVRVCTFVQTALRDRAKASVVYTFRCNGRFVATRTGVRVLLNDLTSTYAFFSKVEVSFPMATRAQCVEGAGKLFDRVLPLLLGHHWPDFEGAEEQFRRQKEAAD
jgi:hypothetical protein